MIPIRIFSISTSMTPPPEDVKEIEKSVIVELDKTGEVMGISNCGEPRREDF